MKPVLRISATVLVVHAGVIWLLIHHMASPHLRVTVDQVMLADVVAELPTQASLPPQSVAARPAMRQQPMRATSPQAVTPEVSKFVPNESLANPIASTGAPVKDLSVIAPSPAASTRTATATPSTVVLPSTDADYLNNPPPPYPRMSRRMGEQGTVLVRVFITVDGLADRAEVRASSGYARLDEAALSTVLRWRFVPGKRAGQPEAMWFNIPIRFMLD